MIDNILEKIINHDNDYSKLESSFSAYGYGHLVKHPYDSYKFAYMGSPVTISILIPCHNSAKTIERCLEHIKNNSYVIKYPDCVEVIVVDDGSTDDTFDILSKSSSPIDVRVIKQSQRYRSGALNTALSIAKNDFILTCDSDMCLDYTCIEETAKRLQVLGDKAILVGFRENISESELKKSTIKTPRFWKDNRFSFDFSLIEPENMFALTNAYKSFGYHKKIYINSKNGINRDVWTLPRMAYGCLFACDRKFFSTIGGYNENFKGWGYEDTLIGALAIATGKYIIPVPAMCGFHIAHPVNLQTIKNTPNKPLYEQYISAKNYDCADYISASAHHIIRQQRLAKSKPGELRSVRRKKTQDYYYYLGEYDMVKNGPNYAKSLFYIGQHNDILNLFPNSLLSRFVEIFNNDLAAASLNFLNNECPEKAYLMTIDTKKLLSTADLWLKQNSVFLAFLYFSLYGLLRGFDNRVKKQIHCCIQKLIKKGNNEVSWCARTF